MCFTLKTTLEKDGRNSTNFDFLTWSIQNFVRTVKQFVRKYYITWIIYLADKLYDREKFIDFILCHVLLKIALSWGYPLWLTCMSSTEKQGQSNFKFYRQKIKTFNSNKQKSSPQKGDSGEKTHARIWKKIIPTFKIVIISFCTWKPNRLGLGNCNVPNFGKIGFRYFCSLFTGT